MWPTVFFPHFIVGRCRSAGTARWLPSWCCFGYAVFPSFQSKIRSIYVSVSTVKTKLSTHETWGINSPFEGLHDGFRCVSECLSYSFCSYLYYFYFSMRTLNNSHFTQRAVPDLRPLCNPAKHTIDLNNGSRYSPSLGFHTLLWFIFHVEHPHMGHTGRAPLLLNSAAEVVIGFLTGAGLWLKDSKL